MKEIRKKKHRETIKYKYWKVNEIKNEIKETHQLKFQCTFNKKDFKSSLYSVGYY